MTFLKKVLNSKDLIGWNQGWKLKKLGAKLKKFKTNDHNDRDTEIQGWCWSLVGAKLLKIKSSKPIRSAIKRN